MIQQVLKTGDIQAALPDVRGRIAIDAPLSRLSWFRTGGSADILFEPADRHDLCKFLRWLNGRLPITVIGVGSNLLVRDGGVEGVVIRLGRAFSNIEVRGDVLKAGAGAMDIHVARKAADLGLGGLEFLVGVPGTIGGAVAMNAGAYGRDIADVLVQASIIDRQGFCREYFNSDLQFAYRVSAVTKDMIVTAATFKVRCDDKNSIRARMEDISRMRGDSQPLGTQTGGSTFKNPAGKKAWELIEAAGCRGLKKGGAQVSEKHCNFLINTGNATAQDLENLGEEVRQRVLDKTGVLLEWEIQRIGRMTVDEVSR